MLSEILVNVDETVEVGTVVARIGSDGAAGASPDGDGEAPQPAAKAEEPPAEAEPEPAGDKTATPSQRPPLTSPLARREATQAGVDVDAIQGSGQGGRVTREDVQAAAGGRGAPQPAAAQAKPAASPQPARSVPLSAGDRERLEDLSPLMVVANRLDQAADLPRHLGLEQQEDGSAA